MSPPQAELFGTWTFGGGLGGSFLYLFEDRTYIFTRWADIMPERVYHKGVWQVADQVLVLTVDSDVTWDRPSDYRFLMYQAKAAAPVRMLGLDRMLGFLEQSIREIQSSKTSRSRLRHLVAEVAGNLVKVPVARRTS